MPITRLYLIVIIDLVCLHSFFIYYCQPHTPTPKLPSFNDEEPDKNIYLEPENVRSVDSISLINTGVFGDNTNDDQPAADNLISNDGENDLVRLCPGSVIGKGTNDTIFILNSIIFFSLNIVRQRWPWTEYYSLTANHSFYKNEAENIYQLTAPRNCGFDRDLLQHAPTEEELQEEKDAKQKQVLEYAQSFSGWAWVMGPTMAMNGSMTLNSLHHKNNNVENGVIFKEELARRRTNGESTYSSLVDELRAASLNWRLSVILDDQEEQEQQQQEEEKIKEINELNELLEEFDIRNGIETDLRIQRETENNLMKSSDSDGDRKAVNKMIAGIIKGSKDKLNFEARLQRMIIPNNKHMTPNNNPKVTDGNKGKAENENEMLTLSADQPPSILSLSLIEKNKLILNDSKSLLTKLIIIDRKREQNQVNSKCN